jgi:hypothetical protein
LCQRRFLFPGRPRYLAIPPDATTDPIAETSYEFAGEVLRERAFYAKYAEELSGAERVLRKLDEMAETMPVDAPWLAPEADVWDRVTTGQWYDSQGLSRVARTLLEICTVGILAVPPSRCRCCACCTTWLCAV